ncbi:MAG: 50S ribosomal protein L18 [Candidatus Woesearchaeota archaeon]
MAKNRNYTVPLRRKREQVTDYKKRLSLLVSKKPRLVVRRSLQNIIVQIVEYKPDGDHIITTAQSYDLKKFGLPVVNGNIPCAYLTGVLIAKKAQEKGVSEVIVDFGLQYVTTHSRLYATIKGARDGGLKLNVDTKVLPSDSRTSGEHIQSFAKTIQSDKARYEKQFSAYIKQNIKPEEMQAVYTAVKEKIMATKK